MPPDTARLAQLKSRALWLAQNVDDELIGATPPQSARDHALTSLLEGVADTLRGLVSALPGAGGEPPLSDSELVLHEIGLASLVDELAHIPELRREDELQLRAGAALATVREWRARLAIDGGAPRATAGAGA